MEKKSTTAIFFEIDELTVEKLDEVIYWFKKTDKSFPKSRAGTMKFLLNKFLEDISNSSVPQNIPKTNIPPNIEKLKEKLTFHPLIVTEEENQE